MFHITDTFDFTLCLPEKKCAFRYFS